MVQLLEWPNVITEGETIEECRESLADAAREMIAAYREQGIEIPRGQATLFEPFSLSIAETADVG